MQLPNVVHPKIFDINGHRVQVVAYCALTDAQARKIALHYVMNHKLKKADPAILLQIKTLWDEDSVGML